MVSAQGEGGKEEVRKEEGWVKSLQQQKFPWGVFHQDLNTVSPSEGWKPGKDDDGGGSGRGELARPGLSPKTAVASLQKCLRRVFYSGFGGLLFVLESLLSLFIWLGRISILLPFTSIKTACQAAGFYDGMTFSTCRKPVPFLAFRGSV